MRYTWRRARRSNIDWRTALSQPRPDGTTSLDRVAAIDIGSNSIRAIVADVSADGHIRVVDEMKSAPRLGAGMDDRGELSQAAMNRATEAVVRMATLARQLGATRVEAVALSAAGLVDRLVSLPFGALRMTERYFPKKITRAAVKELRKDVRHELLRHL